MRKGNVFLGASAVLFVMAVLSFMLYSGDMNPQVQQKVLQQRKTLMVLKPSVTSVTPQKAVLTQGGDPVVIEANGTNLGVINSAQVWRMGNAVPEIEVTLDKSLLPSILKVSLKASATAPIASDYQLAVFDASNNKLLDVPTTVSAIEVVAPVQKAVVAQKPVTAIKTAEPVQRQVQAAPAISLVKPGVTSVTPQKAVLTRGGEAVVVEAKGTNLTGVGSVRVIRAGSEAQGIEETLDKSQLPNTLKVSLKASVEAPVANDYQLAVFDAGSQKVLDVPTAVLAIEVAAPGTKVYAAPMARKPRQQVIAPQDRITAARTDVASISPQKAVLIQGGNPIVVEAKGANLDMVASARVMRAGAPVPEIEASVDRSQLPALLKVSLKASSQAQVESGYQLAVFDTNKKKLLDVPSTALAIEVATPSRTLPTQAKTRLVAERLERSGIPPSTPPYISSWTKSPGYANGEIKFLGRDIVTDFFVAKIGSTALTIVYRSPTEVRAKLPASRMIGDLVAGYGTTSSEYVLEPGYRVIGDPVISSVSPSSFTKGEQVRLSGVDLELVFPIAPAAGGKFLKVSDTSSSPQGSDFLEVINFQVAPDGTSATFNTGGVFAINMNTENLSQQRQLLSPQPSQLTGKLRFAKGGSGSWECTVSSPSSAIYKGTSELRVDKIYGSYWGETSDFVILTSDYTIRDVRVEGTGLYTGTTAKIGDIGINFNLDFRGIEGWAYMPLNAQTNPIIFSRDGLTAASPIIKVIPEPTFMLETKAFLGNSESYVVPIVLNTTYKLQGWYLLPSGVSGLSYSFILGGITEGANVLLECEVLSHTASAFEFRVRPKIPVSDWPEGYQSMTQFGGNAPNYLPLYFEGKYGTIRYLFLKRLFKIVVQ